MTLLMFSFLLHQSEFSHTLKHIYALSATKMTLSSCFDLDPMRICTCWFFACRSSVKVSGYGSSHGTGSSSDRHKMILYGARIQSLGLTDKCDRRIRQQLLPRSLPELVVRRQLWRGSILNKLAAASLAVGRSVAYFGHHFHPSLPESIVAKVAKVDTVADFVGRDNWFGLFAQELSTS